MKPNDPQIHMLTGAYALDALPDDEREAFEEHLEVCPDCAEEADELRATAAHLGGLLREQPSAGLRDAVMAQIADTPQEHRDEGRGAAVSAGPDQRDAAAPGPSRGSEVADLDAERRSRTVPRWVAWTGAAAAGIAAIAAVALGVQLAELNQELDRVVASQSQIEELLAAPDVQTVEVTADDGSSARLLASPARNQAILVAHGMDRAPHAHVYEAWVIDDDGPRSVGLFDADDDGRVSLLIEGELAQAQAVGVTIEPEGGSPEPTTDPIMVLPLSS